MIYFLIIGITLGLSAGISPGPLSNLVIFETLQHNIRSGIKVALAPIVTDLPIVLISLFILNKLTNFNLVLGIISLGGGTLLLFLSYQSLKIQAVDREIQPTGPTSLTKGILTNFLSPHPYLFWLTIGAPTTTKAIHYHPLAGIVFISSFYICLVGAKILVAIITGRSRSFLTGHYYHALIRCLGLFLLIFAVKLFYDGFKLLQILP